MLHRVLFQGGQEKKGAGYRNRFVRSASYVYGLAYGRKYNKRYFYSAFMDLRGIRALVSLLSWRVVNFFREKLRLSWLLPMDPWGQRDLANTNIVPHARKVYALVESGLPTQMTLPALDTVGVESFGGKLNHPFTAHPKACPVTGELLFFGYRGDSKPHCVLSVLSKDGEKGPSVDIDLDKGVMMHDFAITRNFVVILDLPAVFDKSNVFKNNTIYQYDPDRQARVGLVRRSDIVDKSVSLGGAGSTFTDHDVNSLRKVPVEWFLVGRPCYSFHVLNAFEDETANGVVLDLVVYSGAVDLDLARFVANVHQHKTAGGKLSRWVMSHGAISIAEERCLPDHSFEFPVINPQQCGLRHRYGYCATGSFPDKVAPFDLQFRGMTKIDCSKMSSIAEWRTDDGETNDEFVFVSKPGSTAEDDGYLVGYTIRPDGNSSHLVILDAATLRLVCRLQLPQRVPHGFHGNWITPASFS